MNSESIQHVKTLMQDLEVIEVGYTWKDTLHISSQSIATHLATEIGGNIYRLQEGQPVTHGSLYLRSHRDVRSNHVMNHVSLVTPRGSFNFQTGQLADAPSGDYVANVTQVTAPDQYLYQPLYVRVYLEGPYTSYIIYSKKVILGNN